MALLTMLAVVTVAIVGQRSLFGVVILASIYSFLIASVLVVFGVSLGLCRRLDEPKARDLDEVITELLRSPQRLWLRLWPRG